MTETQVPQPEVERDMFRTPGFAWRVGLSIFIVFGWLAFLIVWLFFYAGEFGVFQNIAIFLASVLIGVGVLAAAWASWGIRYAKQMDHDHHMEKPQGATIVNVVAGVGWLLFLVIWLFYRADDYSVYQNLAILIASLMVLGAVTGSAWVLKWLKIRTR